MSKRIGLRHISSVMKKLMAGFGKWAGLTALAGHGEPELQQGQFAGVNALGGNVNMGQVPNVTVLGGNSGMAGTGGVTVQLGTVS